MGLIDREQELLIACLRAEAGTTISISGPIAWARVVSLAERHKLVPLLARCSERIGAPAEVRTALSHRAHEILRRNLGLAGELLTILGLFDRHGIRSLPIKGPVLAESVYGGIGNRQFEDLDILVSRCDLPQSAHLLANHGYRPLQQGRWAGDGVWLRTEYHFPLVHTERGVSVELHADLASYPLGVRLPFDELWARAVRTPLAGRTVLSLSLEDTVLLACLHAAKHAWNSLDMVRAAALLAGQPGTHWNEVLDRATAVGARRMLLLAFLLASDLAGTPAPEPIQRAIDANTESFSALGEQARRSLFGYAGPPLSNLPRFHLRCLGRRRDRCRYLLRLAAPNAEDLKWISLPRPLFPLYWILRPFRVLAFLWPF